MKFNDSDQFVVNRDGQPYRVSFEDVASDVAEKKVKDGKLTIKDGDNVLGEFTANQEGNTDVVIHNSDLTERVSDLEEDVQELSSDVSLLPVVVNDNAPNGSQGDLWFDSDETLQLYVHYNDDWVVASPPVSTEDIENQVIEIQEVLEAADVLSIQRGQQIAALQSNVYNLASGVNTIQQGLGQVNLQEVLDNGNIASKGFVLTDAENDAILVSPEQGRIMAGGIGATVPKYELRHVTDDGFLDTSLVALELDEDGKRFDIECEERVDNIHFRFGNSDKLIINKKGDAEFSGKVKVEPGTEANEVATWGQLASIQDEIDQLTPAFERGSWTWVDSDTPGPGEYTVIKEEDSAGLAQCDATHQQCLIDSSGDPVATSECNRVLGECKDQYVEQPDQDFSQAYKLKFNRLDSSNVDHTFSDVKVNTLIDIFNADDDSFLICKATGSANTDDNYSTINIDTLQSKGSASAVAFVKVFEIAAGDVTNYVRKTGDEMTGPLNLSGDSKYLPLFSLQPTEAGQSSTIFQINDKDGEDIIEVWNNGQAFYDHEPTAEAEIANKKYVDDTVDAAEIRAAEISLGRKFYPTTTWAHVGNSGTTEHLYWDKSLIAWHPTDASGLKVMITATEMGRGENPKFEKGNATIWGYKQSTNEWRMLGCGVHDGEVHVKEDQENTYFYVSVSWKYRPSENPANWSFVRLKLDGYW